MVKKLFSTFCPMKSLVGIMLAFCSISFSCSKENDTKTNAVSDLQVTINVVNASDEQPNGDGSGRVEVSVTAKNAVRYAYRFDQEAVEASEAPNRSHVFTQAGTNEHTIVVWAYDTEGNFVNKTETVSVFRSAETVATLVFSDEFDYEGLPDSEKWHHQVIPPNNGSWFNNEEQHYTDRLVNSMVSNGTLKLTAKKETYTYQGSTKAYTSARLNAKFAFTYGRVEVRAKLPASEGTWPAIWTLGANINETGNFFGDQYGSVGWPNCGEIDILEQKGEDKNRTITHFHWGDKLTGEYVNSGNTWALPDASTEFHVYSLEWSVNSLKVFIDDTKIYELANTSNKPYNEPHYLLLNLAMGGSLGGTIPQNFTEDTVEIDYVRIYQNQ